MSRKCPPHPSPGPQVPQVDAESDSERNQAAGKGGTVNRRLLVPNPNPGLALQSPSPRRPGHWCGVSEGRALSRVCENKGRPGPQTASHRSSCSEDVYPSSPIWEPPGTRKPGEARSALSLMNS